MLNVNEIKSWAKKNGFAVKKQGEGYTWSKEGEKPSEPMPIDQVATEVYNRITENRFVEYQKNYRKGLPYEG